MWFSRDLLTWLSSHILSKDSYIGPKVVELPPEVAKRITFKEQVTDININRLQYVVAKWLYLVAPVLTNVI
jgi:DNA-directed RNA polymerase-5 subunit 1